MNFHSRFRSCVFLQIGASLYLLPQLPLLPLLPPLPPLPSEAESSQVRPIAKSSWEKVTGSEIEKEAPSAATSKP